MTFREAWRVRWRPCLPLPDSAPAALHLGFRVAAGVVVEVQGEAWVLQPPLLFPGSALRALVRVAVLLLGSKSVGLMETLSLGEAHILRAEPVPPSPGTWVPSRGLSATSPLRGLQRSE